MRPSLVIPLTKRPRRLPPVLTKDEVRRLFIHLSGVHQRVARLPYSSGLRIQGPDLSPSAMAKDPKTGPAPCPTP